MIRTKYFSSAIASRLSAVFMLSTLVACSGGESQSSSDRITALEQQLSDSLQRLQLLEDRNEIINLQRIYGYYLDKAQFNQLIGLFTEDISLEYSGRGIYLGKDRARNLMNVMPGGDAQGFGEGMLQNHIQIGGVVHVDDDGLHAKGRWRALIMMGFADGTGAWQEGIYENEYRKENNVWAISKVHFFINVNADKPDGFMSPGTMPRLDESNPPDMPPTYQYDPYPANFLPPYHFENPVTGGQ
ncbi:nuclear transport factor 2 family protein [Gammaproteobacteria bacterium]|nr:nuclear transport factor 2 family protein [Gammaproteobacteria bacterium]